MNVFLSWSGERSHQVALLLNDWLGNVIQALSPWMSSTDIDRGSVWFDQIQNQLKDTSIGIICLTQENKERPWLLFEAGALVKGLTTARVCPFLIDLGPRDISGPLAQFNHTLPSKDGLFRLIKTLNKALESHALKNTLLERAFETHWPQFEEDFRKILAQSPASPPTQPRSTEHILEEILENTRMLNARFSKLTQAPIPREMFYGIFDMIEKGLPDTAIMEAFADDTPPYVLRQAINTVKELLSEK